MSPFRLFGRPPEPEPALETDDEAVTWAPGAWHGEPGPATRHARPVGFGADRSAHDRGVHDDPLTDPFGFPPVSPEPAVWGPRAAPTAVPTAAPVADVAPAGVPDPLEAAALAGAFAADYLSWDEDDPARRGRALADHLGADHPGNPALLGWDGHGRQRAELALPGGVRADGDDRVLVDVRVRVTPYRAVGDRTADRAAELGEPELDVPGVPAAAPAPTGRGWRGCASSWIRLSVPVVRDGHRLVVDATEEACPEEFGAEESTAVERPRPAPVIPMPRGARDRAGGGVPVTPPPVVPESAW